MLPRLKFIYYEIHDVFDNVYYLPKIHDVSPLVVSLLLQYRPIPKVYKYPSSSVTMTQAIKASATVNVRRTGISMVTP